MSKNIKVLNDSELEYIKNHYIFSIFNNYIVVQSTNYMKRKTLHDIDKKFTITTPVRRVTITTTAINLWINKYKDIYSLIEVQNALSSLIVTYRDITDDEVDEQLKRKQNKIKIINKGD